MASIRLDRVVFGYNGNRVFDGLTLAVSSGATTALIGPNGCGKSTLLGLIAGLSRPEQGSVDLDGADNIALAVQRDQVADAFPITVAEAVAMGRWRDLGLLRRPSRSDRDTIDHWIDALGLTALRRRRLDDLSGGQRQRVLLAQAFAQQAQILLLDEPTAGLDTTTADLVYDHLGALAATGVTVLAATHDLDALHRFDDRVQLTGTPALPLS